MDRSPIIVSDWADIVAAAAPRWLGLDLSSQNDLHLVVPLDLMLAYRRGVEIDDAVVAAIPRHELHAAETAIEQRHPLAEVYRRRVCRALVRARRAAANARLRDELGRFAASGA